MIDLNLLNKDQKEAVLNESKYLRIVAGAGSGKTRVLTMRIAHLIQDKGVDPTRILAITFTNKAAAEMKERIRGMLTEETSQPWISTIHSLCVRILREDIGTMGYPRNFTIMDTDDQKAVLREAYKQFDLDIQQYSYASMLDYIANCKSANMDAARALELAGGFNGDKMKAKVYAYYLKKQQDMYALDFDDLILWTVRMFKTWREVEAKWQRRFHYIHVDEFQDIDKIQYQLIRQLAGEDNALYVVGDPDQTIYTWRGADVNIIMNFRRDFPDCQTITLNENYRSTEAILNGANSVIHNNKNRMEKDLFTRRAGKEIITHYASADDTYEAMWIAETIHDLHGKGKSYHDIAILYRSNYLSRSLEKALLEERIPYIIYGGLRFYERQEVKDALCYLRMVTNGDDLAFARIVNRPKRGVGQKTLSNLQEKAAELGCSMYEVLKKEPDFIGGKIGSTLQKFVAMVEDWRVRAAHGDVEIFRLFEQIIEESGYKADLEENREIDRMENLKELIDDVKQFSLDYPESSIDEYMQTISLYTDRDKAQGSEDCVQLMTVHASKGLEFDTVFISDLNDGIFPNERAMNDGPKGVEEERRLAYVAFTRAQNKLYLCEAGGFSFVLQRVRTTSRFIKEIDEQYIEHLGATQRENTSFYGRSDFRPIQKPIAASTVAQPALRTVYRKSDIVVHKVFGEGVVLSVKNGIVEVAFPFPHGVKKLSEKFPGMKKKNDLKS